MIDSMIQSRTMKAAAAAACMILAALTAGCEGEGDPTAPEGSTISVSANPQTVVVPTGGAGTTEIIATVRSKNGTRLPDQEITFSTTAGIMDPTSETPLTSDDLGQARAMLTTSSSATVTASSGSISDMTQIQTAPGDLAQFLLSVTPEELTSCNDTLTLQATVFTTSGDPVPGFQVIFEEVPPSTINGSFSPASVVLTLNDGTATVTWTAFQSGCIANCQGSTMDPNSPGCMLTFQASDFGGSFASATINIDDNIP